MKTSLLSFVLLSLTVIASPAAETFYVGTFTQPGKSVGIYRYDLNPDTGEVRDLGLAVEAASPAFLALHPKKPFLYSVNEVNQGTVSAFAIQPDGSLKELNRQSSKGSAPTHISVDHDGRNLLVANYNSGSVACLPIKEDGSLSEAAGYVQNTGAGPDPRRQKGPHAHSIYVAEGDRQVYACDLGLDKVFLFQLDPAKGTLTPGEPPFTAAAPGSGPRHLAFGKGEHFLYVAGEMSNTVTVFSRKADTGALTEVQQISSLPADFKGSNTAAEMVVHPSGEFAYASNRGHDSLAGFSVDPKDGKLKLLGHTAVGGKGPRFFTIDPSGKWLLAANQGSNNLVVFKLDEKTGSLTPTGQVLERGEPVCVVFGR